MTDTPDENTLSEHIVEAQFSVPWQYNGNDELGRDADGFLFGSGSTSKLSREQLHARVIHKYHTNPHVNTSTRGLVGRIAGKGFGVVSDVDQVEQVIDEIENDYRNRLFDYWPKYLTKAFLSGELFLCFTCHDDGFIEIDYIDPDAVRGDADDGIIFHPKKTRMPLVYCIKDEDNGIDEQVPSIYLARYPELIEVAKKLKGFSHDKLLSSRTRKAKFRKLGGFNRFIVSWDLGLITSRNSSHLQTTLEWINLWENLKKYEIDHKKSSGAYVYVVKFNDAKSWLTWLNLTDAERSQTGIAQPKTPGGTMVIGPNMEVKVTNPQLPNISDSDTDIMQMISSGLNEPADVTTGQAKGTFASVKASRGPMSDKVSDEMAFFERWLRWDFWGNIFFIKSVLTTFPSVFAVEEATHFKDKEPVFEKVNKRPERCLEIIFPVSAVENIEGQAKAMLGVKHGSLNDTAGIPNAEILERMGFRGYGKLRLKKATEDNKYPETILTLDQESYQEKTESDPKRKQADEQE